MQISVFFSLKDNLFPFNFSLMKMLLS